MDSYFLALSDIKSQSTNDDTIAPHTQDETITLQEKVNFVKLLLKRPKRKVIIFDAKMALKFLMLGLQIQVQNCFVFDPKIATWMLKPGEAQPTLGTMVMTFNPGLSGLLETLGTAKGQGSVAMNLQSHAKPRSRAVAESVLVMNLVKPLSDKLTNEGLISAFEKVEMPSILTLTSMELNGFGFSMDECEKQRKVLMARLEELEEKAYKEAKRNFSMTSSDDICRLLYRELKLPTNGAKPSSAKDQLQKISHLHPLPGLILEWRKLNASVTKVFFKSKSNYDTFNFCASKTLF